MTSRAGLFILVAIAGAAACGGPADTNFSDPAHASGRGASGGSASGGKGGKGGSSGKGGSNATGGKGGSSGTSGSSSATGGSGDATGTGGDGTGGTGMDTGGAGNETGGTGMDTGGTGGGETGGTAGSGSETGGTAGMGASGMEAGGAGGSRAGAGGKGGKGGSAGGPDCDMLAEVYAKALDSARVCNADSGKDQCTEKYASSFGCGCPVFVNPDNEEAIATLDQVTKQGAGCVSICPAIACIEPVSGTCEPGADKGSGVCTTLNAVPL